MCDRCRGVLVKEDHTQQQEDGRPCASSSYLVPCELLMNWILGISTSQENNIMKSMKIII